MSYECWKLADIPEGEDERREGYSDGYAGEPAPGGNRSPAYQHGWHTGAADGGHIAIPDWMRARAREYVHHQQQGEAA